ncbi:hypothetical protein [Vogesella sp. LIG4]|uniref:hypothetical protein n=1 Tax=Vogesella sp. LIG4 TaxID=1192162 RepID=UPI0008200CEB|nr:hypothetical protein [Vogesella sp. LIG4]SCK19169.1 hypothetical protein PSELUDRAFT_2091 [Vogesella sp. LIG4]
MGHGNYIALFDVLGFEERLEALGLQEMLIRYEALIDTVNYRKHHTEHVFEKLGFSEEPYWTAEGDILIFTKTHGAYASDSILLWANRTWPAVSQENEESFLSLASNATNGWKYHPIPCDNFLEVCNDLMCRGLEVGLPLRGAISIGEAVLDSSRSIFLGKPIIEAARLEAGQRLIGTSFCSSMVAQFIPQRFKISFDNHIKENYHSLFGGAMLDWPRHWRNTRKSDLREAISKLNTNEKYSEYYKNTLEMISFSETFADQFESLQEKSIRTQYDQFSWSNSELSVSCRAIRRVSVS